MFKPRLFVVAVVCCSAASVARADVELPPFFSDHMVLQREGKAEEAKATAEGFEIFVKCGTTIKCLLGPEKVTGTALGALTTGDNGHLTFSKASLGKGEGATCPSEATLDVLDAQLRADKPLDADEQPFVVRWEANHPDLFTLPAAPILDALQHHARPLGGAVRTREPLS